MLCRSAGRNCLLTSFSSGQLFAERQGGDRTAVVALHGWGRDRRDFADVLKGLDSLSFDLPGFGLSPAPPQPWDTGEYAACVHRVVSALPDPPVLVGHSFGGRVALRLAAAYPQSVAGLVLTGVPLIRPPRWKRGPLVYRVARALNRRKLLGGAVMERVRAHYGSDDYNNAEGVLRDVLVRAVNESYEDDLRALQCPTRLIWGGNDTAAPVWMAQRALELTGRVELTVVDGVGHFVPLQAPQSLRQAVDELLERRDVAC